MRTIRKKLTVEQKTRNVIFTSTLSTEPYETEGTTTHEVLNNDSDKWAKIERLSDASFFRNSPFKYNIIRN